MNNYRANIRRMYTNPAIRSAVFILSVLLSTLVFGTGILTLSHWDDLWSAGNYYESYSVHTPNSIYTHYVSQLAQLKLTQSPEWGGTLSYSEQESLENFQKLLSPTATNFRYQLHTEDGTPISNNLDGVTLESLVYRVQAESFRITSGADDNARDYLVWDSTGEERILMVYDSKTESFLRCNPKGSVTYNQYGYRSYNGVDWSDYHYDESFDSRITSAFLVLEYGVLNPVNFEVDDAYRQNFSDYINMQDWLPITAIVFFSSIFLLLCALVFLWRSAGLMEDGGIQRNWQDKIPLDLYVCGGILLIALFLNAGDTAAYNLNQFGNRASIVGVGLFSILICIVLLGAFCTLSVRLRTSTLFSNTLIWRFFSSVSGTLHTMFFHWSLTRRVVLLFFAYLVGTVLTGVTIVLILPYQLYVLWRLCLWTLQWRDIQDGTTRIVGGDPDFKISTGKKMYPDLRLHAEHLNDLGGAIGSAVDERLRSERFKAELITNVSHDLKTPLTSIINYVDLLKKVELQEPKAQEYIEVLDRKSQRLKKLTEDLVEASKASTGTLSVSRERLGFCQLVNQALGEYEEKFATGDLTLVPSLPEQEVYLEADGRHLWRVLDNLMGNCVKYALPGTRVYLEVAEWDGNAVFSMKNISKNPLNVSPEQLMERFVRGDSSRTTEGSGLGLSIARSLTELQGGTFRLDIDGDLFKAMVLFPILKEPLPLPPHDFEKK